MGFRELLPGAVGLTTRLPDDVEPGRRSVLAGTIDKEEFIQWSESLEDSTQGAGSIDSICDGIFHLVNPGGGGITASQLLALLSKIDKTITLHDVMEMVSDIDEDGDGIITRKEFRVLIANNIDDL